MKKYIIIFILVILTSCMNESKETIKDGDFKIELLFKKDGCNVYRFRDGGRYIYWSNCSGNMQSNYTQSSGKSTTTIRMESFTN